MGSLAELFSEGKSGSFFYFSNDGRYLIKTRECELDGQWRRRRRKD